MISLWAARGGDTRERYESVLILYASRTDRLTDPFGRPVFSSSISCSRIPCRIVYLRYRGGDARLYIHVYRVERETRRDDSGPFQALRNNGIETAAKMLVLCSKDAPRTCLLYPRVSVWAQVRAEDPNLEIEPVSSSRFRRDLAARITKVIEQKYVTELDRVELVDRD